MSARGQVMAGRREEESWVGTFVRDLKCGSDAEARGRGTGARVKAMLWLDSHA